ncbi:MAG TPA: D-alanine--D-alanine ligase family protein [Gemmatimonadota bacterium]|nr:D-alanine--D-alanine ligase family protein [Gemmatimonadota bacterium]
MPREPLSGRQPQVIVSGGRKLRVGVLFGGSSSEHEVSLMSARSVLGALDPAKYEIVQIGITKEGRWLIASDAVDRLIERAESAGALEGQVERTEAVALLADPALEGRLQRTEVSSSRDVAPLDVLFPLIHGRTGEDGALQGLFELSEVAYVGAGITGSAVGMDKEIAKAVWTAAGLPVGPYRVVRWTDWRRDPTSVRCAVAAGVGFPCFVKPASSGSSIGVHKVHSVEELEAAIEDAARYDSKILAEEAIEGRELECGVLGNEDPEASVVGEIVPGHEFYDYEDKYLDDAVDLVIPADVPDETSDRVRELALAAFRAIDARGMSRVDFFLEAGTGRIYLNEINTIPGFTRVSMYPMLWEASGVSFPELCDRLIALALEDRKRRAALKRTR